MNIMDIILATLILTFLLADLSNTLKIADFEYLWPVVFAKSPRSRNSQGHMKITSFTVVVLLVRTICHYWYRQEYLSKAVTGIVQQRHKCLLDTDAWSS